MCIRMQDPKFCHIATVFYLMKYYALTKELYSRTWSWYILHEINLWVFAIVSFFEKIAQCPLMALHFVFFVTITNSRNPFYASIVVDSTGYWWV